MEEATHTREYCGTYIDSVPREICNVLEVTRSASSNRSEECVSCIEGHDDHEATNRSCDKDDVGTGLTFVRWGYDQPVMVQLFMDCVDRATSSSTALVSIRELPRISITTTH